MNRASPDGSPDHSAAAAHRAPWGLLALRSAIGGVMMGLANLVPGISGGTMLLAAGVYPQFINAISEVTTLQFRRRSLLVLACVVAAAVIVVMGLAGPVMQLVLHQRWVMYSVFIGLTLGGVPVIWRLIRRHAGSASAATAGPKAKASVWVAAGLGLVLMAMLALVQSRGGGSADRSGVVLMFVAGLAGASAMILPGVSGAYLLLVLGVYVPVLAAIAQFKDALGARDMPTLLQIAGAVIVPIGIGIVVGVGVISNLLRWLLRRYEKATLGFLLGLLVGAVVGLWPFQEGVAPAPGQTLKGQTVAVDDQGQLYFESTGKPVEPDDYPTEFFRPGAGHVAGAVALVAAGFLVTCVVDLIGRDRRSSG